MFDFVMEIIGDEDYDEISSLVSELEYYTKVAKKALGKLVNDIEYTWTNEQYHITHQGILHNLISREDNRESAVWEELYEEGDIYQTAVALFNELGLANEGKDLDDWVDEFIAGTQLSYDIISTDN